VYESKLPYFNTIRKNVEDVNIGQLEVLYRDLENFDLIVPIAEGRSRYVLNMACSEMAKMKNGKIVMDRRDIGFPGRNMMEALPVLRERYGRVLVLINSGGGKSTIPQVAAGEASKYIRDYEDKDGVAIDLITSDPNSPIGLIAKEYGNVVKLKGREKTEGMDDEEIIRTFGSLGDSFELGAGWLLYLIDEILYKKIPIESFLDLHNKLYPTMIKRVDEIIESEEFNYLIRKMSTRAVGYFAGLGSGHDVARTANVRMTHVKQAVGEPSYVAGESSTPSARPGDLLVPILEDDKEVDGTMADWCIEHKKLDGEIMCIAESKDLETVKLSDQTIILDQERDKYGPNKFHIEATYLLSAHPILLIAWYKKYGFPIPESLLRYKHAVTG